MEKIRQVARLEITGLEFKSKAIPLVVILFSSCVIVSWIVDFAPFLSVGPDWATMKFVSAVLFVLSGFALLLRQPTRRSYLKGMVLVTGIYALTSYGQMLSFMPNFETDPTLTVVNDYPSLLTIFCFLIFGLSGWWPRIRKATGKLLIWIPIIALFGYLVDSPFLYGYVEDVSAGMAFHTAILFGHLGAYLIDLRLK